MFLLSRFRHRYPPFYKKIASELNEKTRRRWAVVEAQLGYGGIAAVSRATGMIPRAIRDGIKEISQGTKVETERQRKPLSEKHSGLIDVLEKLVEPYSIGDPMRPLRWTCKSTYNLSDELKEQGFPVSPTGPGCRHCAFVPAGGTRLFRKSAENYRA